VPGGISMIDNPAGLSNADAASWYFYSCAPIQRPVNLIRKGIKSPKDVFPLGPAGMVRGHIVHTSSFFDKLPKGPVQADQLPPNKIFVLCNRTFLTCTDLTLPFSGVGLSLGKTAALDEKP
jgi:hypothetical protein